MKEEWEEKQKRKAEQEKEKEKEKDKDKEDKEKDKDDDKDKEKKSTPIKSSHSSVSPPSTPKSSPAHQRYALHRDIFASTQYYWLGCRITH